MLRDVYGSHKKPISELFSVVAIWNPAVLPYTGEYSLLYPGQAGQH